MDEMKDKMKGFMKKVNNPFSSSSSGKFKGQGRVLGSSSSGPTNSVQTRPYQHLEPKPTRPHAPSASANSVHSPQKTEISDPPQQSRSENRSYSTPSPKPTSGFDPFDSLITTGKRNKNGYSLQVVECPVCGGSFASEEEVSEHVETCLVSSESTSNDGVSNETIKENHNELEACVGAYVSGKPSDGSLEITIKLLKNVIREPENVKFRKVRLGNSKIKEAVADVAGGLDLLEFVGFELKEEGGEMWAEMEFPSTERIAMINQVLVLLEPRKNEDLASVAATKIDEGVERGKIDDMNINRQIRAFFPVPESVAANIELPDSFYNLSINEVKKEADTRRKKLAESELLVPKSLKEKQAKAARKRYAKTVIRVQFPDGMVLQGVFSPREPTTALYEFVSSALKEPSLEFELLHPVAIKRRVIPCFPKAGERAVSLEEEDLVPAALIKFRPLETDSVVFTGLRNELLQTMEPLVSNTAVAPH